MSKHFCPTRNKTIKYLYQEMSEPEKEEFVPVLFQNEELEEEFCELLNVKEQLDQIELSPSKNCIQNILEFAREKVTSEY